MFGRLDRLRNLHEITKHSGAIPTSINPKYPHTSQGIQTITDGYPEHLRHEMISDAVDPE